MLNFKKIELYETKNTYYVYTQDWDLIGMGSSIVISERLMHAIKETFIDDEWFSKINSRVIMGCQPGDNLNELLDQYNIPHGIPKEPNI